MKNADLIFLTGSNTPQATHSVDKHLEGYYTLQFMASGGVELFYDEQRYEMYGAWFWPAYPGPHIRFHVASGYPSWHHRHVAFRGPLVQRWIAEGLFPLSPQPALQDIAYCSIFDALLQQIKRMDYWGTLRAIHTLEGLLIDLAEARSQQQDHVPAWIQELVAYFASEDANFTLDYEQLAQHYGMSLSTLRRQFGHMMGMPLHTYVLQCKIARARRLLAETDLTIKMIAHRVGYSDVYYFSRHFRQLVGVPPALYRKSGHM